MIVKFVPVRGACYDAARYLAELLTALGKLRPVAPVKISGSLSRFLAVAIASFFWPTYLSVVLSYSENRRDLSLPKLVSHVNSCVRLLTGGLPSCRYAFVAFLHERENGFDIHILLAKRDLMTGLCLPLWSATKNEYRLMRIWRRLINLRDNLSDPEDPWRRRFLVRIPPGLTRAQREEFRLLDYEVTVAITSGEIRNRRDICLFF
jgi:hypothetical protein